jgi:hypothetical protein
MGEVNNARYKTRYGNWAGNPDGHKPDFKRCCEEVRAPERWGLYHQCTRPRGYGPDAAYCKQHDPEVVNARKEKADTEYRKKHRADMTRVYGSSFLRALRQIAEGHNDPRSLAKEIVSDFDAKYPQEQSHD